MASPSLVGISQINHSSALGTKTDRTRSQLEGASDPIRTGHAGFSKCQVNTDLTG